MNSDGIIEDDDYSIERELKREAHRRGDTKRRRGDDGVPPNKAKRSG